MKKFLSFLIITSILFYTKSNISYSQSTPITSYEIEYISEYIYIETFITEYINNSTKSTTTVTISCDAHRNVY